mgnify:CR=1 FL=1
MRVLLAGGAGFIGSHLSDLLLNRGDEVVAIDNLSTGRSRNIDHLVPHPGFSFVHADITQPLPTDGPCANSFDAVLDLASPASPNDFATMPLEILDVGSTGTRHLLERARRDRARFLLASTSEVYGDPLVHPQPETYWGNVSSIGPRSCYDEAKRFSEALTMAYHRTHGLDVRIARIFNTYGERMRPLDGRVVNTFVVQALHAHGATTGAMSPRMREQSARALALARTVIELTGSSSKIRLVPLPPEREGDPLQRCPDITVATKELGWVPSVSLRSGLEMMIAFFASHEDLV